MSQYVIWQLQFFASKAHGWTRTGQSPTHGMFGINKGTADAVM